MNLSPEEFHPLVELAAEKTSDGLLCANSDGNILYANEAAARALNQSAATITGRTMFEIAPDLNAALWRELWKEIRDHAAFAFEFTLSATGDRQVPVEISAHYLRPARRDLACFFFRDIEERKRLQNLQQEFLSTASHELRTPMTVIREGVSQVAEGLRGDINGSQRRALTLALNGIDRMGRLIGEILDISKIESGKVTLRRERLDLAGLAREVAGEFQALAGDRGLDLRLTTPAGPLMVYADRDRLVQVLTNLVNNSFKFTEQGHIQIIVTAREGEAECAVADTGMGLAQADADKIFNKFEQVGQTSVTGEKGTGLGLSISRAIVELHKGRIWAESAGPGLGMRVVFVLPRQSGRDVFIDQLTPMLHHVARRGGSLSSVIFQIEPLSDKPTTEGQVSAVLAGLENLIRKHSGRKTDILLKDADAMYLALESTVKREAARIADRIIIAFQESLAREGLGSRLRMTYTITAFPDEAADEGAYLKNVFKGERA